MNILKDMDLCYGCGACCNVCGRNAIVMSPDSEGFLIPQIDESKCINCGACKSVCPRLNKNYDKSRKPRVYAVMADDNIRSKSSSGGVFTLLAEYVLGKNGYVCGAEFTENFSGVRQVMINSVTDLDKLRCSKYIQSDNGDIFKKVKSILEIDEWVLFVGTPCQCAALQSFLKVPYEKLIIVDLICHSTPSPMAWNRFVNEISGGKKVKNVNFRYKGLIGWSNTTYVEFDDNSKYISGAKTDAYEKAFTKGLISRRSCGKCEFARIPRQGDITLGDFWGVAEYDKNLNDKKGTSVVLVNSPKGEKIFEEMLKTKIVKLLREVPFYNAFVRKNSNIYKSPVSAPGREKFFEALNNNIAFSEALTLSENEKYDIALFSVWYAANYGSLLTNYALYTTLTDMGYNCIFADIPDHLWPTSRTHRDPLSVTRRFGNKHFKITRKYKDKEDLKKLNGLCNTFLVGSDQIWNYKLCKSAETYFFLDFVNENKRKISYGTSFGHNEFRGSESDRKKAEACLRRFNAISVREDYAVDMCGEFGVEAVQVLDPVFLCDKKHYFDRADESRLVKKPPAGPYLLAYILDPNEEKQEALEYAAKKLGGIDIICIPNAIVKEDMRNAWRLPIKENIDVEDWLYYFKNAQMVITDSFHGTCFSIIFEKQFISIINIRRGKDRFSSLLGDFELLDYLVEQPNEIKEKSALFEEKIDYEKVNSLISKKKEESLAWLTNALTCEKKLLGENKENTELSAQGSKLPSYSDNPDLERCRMLASLLRDYGIRHIVLSSGTRHVNLVRFFEANDCFTTYNVIDERSAGFFAIGLALKLKETVAICCTSGTAASNYISPITEAYYQGVPIVAITADRYPCLLNQQEQQMVPQMNIFNGIVKKSVQLPVTADRMGAWETRRMICDCLLEVNHHGSGPVHIDVPIKHIIRKKPDDDQLFLGKYRRIFRVPYIPDRNSWKHSVEQLKASHKILLFWGQCDVLNPGELEAVNEWASHFDCVICTDHLSNLHCNKSINIYNLMKQLSSENKEAYKELVPDILITVGGNSIASIAELTAGKSKLEHWNILPDGRVSDPYKKLVKVFECDTFQFIKRMNSMAADSTGDNSFYEKWMKHLPAPKELPKEYGQSYAIGKIINDIPENSDLHLANSNTVRFANEYELKESVTVYCNRGTNGIDGSASSFMGMSAVSSKLCFLIIGDLSFFYDLNSLWNKEIKGNIRIMLLNNGGTSLLSHLRSTAITYSHNAAAKGWVSSLGFKYLSSRNKEEFDAALQEFLSEVNDQAVFFEVFC